MITPFSQLSWWQKKKFQWKFRDPEYLRMLKRVREKLIFRNGYVCHRVLEAGAELYQDNACCSTITCSVHLVDHITSVQGVSTYRYWMEKNHMVFSTTAVYWGRKAWVDQMIKALES